MKERLCDMVHDLEEAYAELGKSHNEVSQELDDLGVKYCELNDQHEAAVAELMWFRATYPDGQKAFEVSERISND